MKTPQLVTAWNILEKNDKKKKRTVWVISKEILVVKSDKNAKVYNSLGYIGVKKRRTIDERHYLWCWTSFSISDRKLGPSGRSRQRG